MPTVPVGSDREGFRGAREIKPGRTGRSVVPVFGMGLDSEATGCSTLLLRRMRISSYIDRVGTVLASKINKT